MVMDAMILGQNRQDANEIAAALVKDPDLLELGTVNVIQRKFFIYVEVSTGSPSMRGEQGPDTWVKSMMAEIRLQERFEKYLTKLDRPYTVFDPVESDPKTSVLNLREIQGKGETLRSVFLLENLRSKLVNGSQAERDLAVAIGAVLPYAKKALLAAPQNAQTQSV